MQCLILAGGLGTRMLPMTQHLPKALIPVAGHPFAHHQLSLLARQGVRRVVYSIGYHGRMLRDYVGDGRRFGLTVEYVDEGENLLGTAGAIRHAVDQGALESGFLLLYGDSYLPIAVAPVWQASGQGQTPLMTILRNKGRWDRSNVRFGPNQQLYYDKRMLDSQAVGMDYIDYGLSVLTRDVILESVPAGVAADLADVFHALSIKGRLQGYEVAQRFYECGSPQGVRELEEYLLQSGIAP